MLGVKNGTNLSKAYIVQNKWVDPTTYFLWIFFLKSSFVKLGIWVVLGSCDLVLISKGGIRVFSNHENPHQQTCRKQSRLRESSSTPRLCSWPGQDKQNWQVPMTLLGNDSTAVEICPYGSKWQWYEILPSSQIISTLSPAFGSQVTDWRSIQKNPVREIVSHSPLFFLGLVL